MSILTLPSAPGFTRTRFGLASNTQSDLVSPISQSAQLLELPGARWTARYQLPPMIRAQAAEWQAFLVRLRGRSGQFFAFDPDARSARGSARLKAPGALTVAGGSPSPSGALLPLVGAGANEAGVFLKGDYLAYDVVGASGTGRQLHMVVADSDADASGALDVSIEPPIRRSPAAGETIIVTDASCVMRLETDRVAWDADNLSRFGVAFDAIEVFL